jgi:hypothetical protein
MIDFSIHEVLVFWDGCTGRFFRLKMMKSIGLWYSSEVLGASAPTFSLSAKGEFLIGLDDDASFENRFY